MRVSVPAFATLALVAAAATCSAVPASAMSMKECSAQYKAAKTRDTLAGKSWNDFRKSECGSASSAAAAPTATAPATATTTTPMAKKSTAASTVPASSAVFPSKIATTYANEKPGKARMHTCLDQYRTNKATNANGGLRWIQTGGGYYSVCNARLKS